MDQSRTAEVMQKMDQAIAQAQQVLQAAHEAREQSGLGSAEELQALLESQLSSQDIAMVNAKVDEEIARIQDLLKARRMHSSPARKITSKTHISRRMI